MRITMWVGREARVVVFPKPVEEGDVVYVEGANYRVLSMGWFLHADASVAGAGLHHGPHAYVVRLAA